VQDEYPFREQSGFDNRGKKLRTCLQEMCDFTLIETRFAEFIPFGRYDVTILGQVLESHNVALGDITGSSCRQRPPLLVSLMPTSPT
jgi:hypothetical protein